MAVLAGIREILGQSVRFLARAAAPARFQTSFLYKGNNTIIVVEALDDRGNFLNGADFQGVFLDERDARHSVAFSQTAPGRYEAPVRGTGTLFGKILRTQGSDIVEEAVVQSPGSFGEEYRPRPSGREALRDMAGSIADSPESLVFSNRESEQVQPLQDKLLWLAAFLFLLDVASRKISLRDLKMPERKAAAIPASASPFLRLKETKKAVIQDLAPLESALSAAEPRDVSPPDTPPIPPSATAETDATETVTRLKEARRKRHRE